MHFISGSSSFISQWFILCFCKMLCQDCAVPSTRWCLYPILGAYESTMIVRIVLTLSERCLYCASIVNIAHILTLILSPTLLRIRTIQSNVCFADWQLRLHGVRWSWLRVDAYSLLLQDPFDSLNNIAQVLLCYCSAFGFGQYCSFILKSSKDCLFIAHNLSNA